MLFVIELERDDLDAGDLREVLEAIDCNYVAIVDEKIEGSVLALVKEHAD